MNDRRSVALTTDSWTSRATESYLTVTVNLITAEWEIKSHVFQTRPIESSHTSVKLGEELREVVAVWKLERDNVTIPVTTDNARNILNAVALPGLGPQIGCFAHVINLVSQKAMSVNPISRLLAKIRKVVSFHKSTTAAHVFKTKQEMLELPNHKLIQDVPTRWKSI